MGRGFIHGSCLHDEVRGRAKTREEAATLVLLETEAIEPRLSLQMESELQGISVAG
jgi:hypothetical protein